MVATFGAKQSERSTRHTMKLKRNGECPSVVQSHDDGQQSSRLRSSQKNSKFDSQNTNFNLFSLQSSFSSHISVAKSSKVSVRSFVRALNSISIFEPTWQPAKFLPSRQNSRRYNFARLAEWEIDKFVSGFFDALLFPSFGNEFVRVFPKSRDRVALHKDLTKQGFFRNIVTAEFVFFDR